MAVESLYEHADGDEGLQRLEVLFYDKALADPVLRTLFTGRVPTHVDHLTWFSARVVRRARPIHPSAGRRHRAAQLGCPGATTRRRRPGHRARRGIRRSA
jgi:truncated hemoglobin YjbI